MKAKAVSGIVLTLFLGGMITLAFRIDIGVAQSTPEFIDSGQSLGSSYSRYVALGDVDGDGDLDAFVTNYVVGNRVWVNDGTGTYSSSGQSLGSSWSYCAALGDLDGDGDLDAFVANWTQANRVWVNGGTGTYSSSGQSLGSSNSVGVALGDVDGDGDLDAFVANYDEANKVWLNAPPIPKPVGGKATPINIPMTKPELQTPWIWLTTIILSLAVTVVYVKKRKRNTRIIS